jgi:hypothetical protein
MSMRDHYRTRAAEFHARARNESNEMNRRQYESLATKYSRLAETADRNDNETSAPTAATQNGPRANLE